MYNCILSSITVHGHCLYQIPFTISVYFDVKKSKKDAEKAQMVKQFIAWWIDKHFLNHPEERLVVLFDMSEAGLSNMVIYLLFLCENFSQI